MENKTDFFLLALKILERISSDIDMCSRQWKFYLVYKESLIQWTPESPFIVLTGLKKK